MVLVDTGPLVAAANRNDTHHRASTEALAAAPSPRLVPGNITELVTLDQRHFNVVRPRHVEALTLTP